MIEDVLEELRAGLEQSYADRFRGLYVFGSYARGDASGESDLDVLVVLDHVEHPAEEIDRTSELTSRVSLAHDVSVSRVFVGESEFRARESPFLRRIGDELVPA